MNLNPSQLLCQFSEKKLREIWIVRQEKKELGFGPSPRRSGYGHAGGCQVSGVKKARSAYVP